MYPACGGDDWELGEGHHYSLNNHCIPVGSGGCLH